METPKKNKSEQIENLLEKAQQLAKITFYIRKKQVPSISRLGPELNPDDETQPRIRTSCRTLHRASH